MEINEIENNTGGIYIYIYILLGHDRGTIDIVPNIYILYKCTDE